MPFGVIGRTGPGMRQAVAFGDRSTGRGTFGDELGRAIVTEGDFTAYVRDSAATRPSSQITLGKPVMSSNLQRRRCMLVVMSHHTITQNRFTIVLLN